MGVTEGSGQQSALTDEPCAPSAGQVDSGKAESHRHQPRQHTVGWIHSIYGDANKPFPFLYSQAKQGPYAIVMISCAYLCLHNQTLSLWVVISCTILSPTASAGSSTWQRLRKYLTDGQLGCFILTALPRAIHCACSRILLDPKGARLSHVCILEVGQKGGKDGVLWSILELLPC